MKLKTLTFILGLVFVGALAYAGVGQVSRTTEGDIHDSSVYPAKASSTLSTAVMNPFDDGGMVYGIWHTTATATTAFITIRDSNTANTSSDIMMRVFFDSSTVLNSTYLVPTYKKFDPPLRIQNGLSIDSSACPSAAAWCYTVLYDSNP